MIMIIAVLTSDRAIQLPSDDCNRLFDVCYSSSETNAILVVSFCDDELQDLGGVVDMPF